jgi:hypothetical protein
MAAVAQTQDPRNTGPAPKLADIYLLSLGTGTNLSYIKGKDLDWGLAQWAKPLVNLLLDANMGIADFQCRQLLKETYRRVAPTFPQHTNIKMDEWKRSQELLDLSGLADSWTGKDVVTWLKTAGWYPVRQVQARPATACGDSRPNRCAELVAMKRACIWSVWLLTGHQR